SLGRCALSLYKMARQQVQGLDSPRAFEPTNFLTGFQIMGRFTRTIVLAAGLLVSTQPVFGDDLVTIMELAMRNDPQLRQAEAQLNSARQQVRLARASLLPQLSASVSEQR